MNSADRIARHASDLIDSARALQVAAGDPGSSAGVPGALASLEEALQVLSRAWYQLAADAAPRIAERGGHRFGSANGDGLFDDALSREQQVCLFAALQDIATRFAGSARECRKARTTVGPLLEAPAKPSAHARERLLAGD